MTYMSQEGYDKMVAELQRLESVERPKASAAIAEARDKDEDSGHVTSERRCCADSLQGGDDKPHHQDEDEIHYCKRK